MHFLVFLQETIEASRSEPDESAIVSSQMVGQANVTDLDAIATLLRSRAYRGDLMGENVSAFGNIDLKMFSENSAAKMEFKAIAGPLFYRRNVTSTSTSGDIGTEEVSSESSRSPELEPRPDDSIDVSLATEIDFYSERRSVRDDIRAAALLKANGPFRWSAAPGLKDVDHNGHPDEWNFKAVSPKWAWD